VQLTLVDGGVDLLLKGVSTEGLQALESMTSFAVEQRLARLSVDQGLGPETVYEPHPTTITLTGVPVTFPVGGFLQATSDGETALIVAVEEAVDGSAQIGDLFAGLGTFALAVKAGYAAEAGRDASAALKRAAPSMRVEHRDLYRRPLDVAELKAFEAVILDPPRAGAEEQVGALATSAVRRVAYVSCNPATFARDAKLLVDGGYTLEWVRPVGQFRWSTHVELAAAFVR
jgi:23S rRNA (uracil1939-C5)-methyltransferase